MARVLLIAKTPMLHRLAVADRERVVASGAADGDRLRSAADRHAACLAAVRAALAGDAVAELAVEEVRPGAHSDADLVVTVGGDGTVFTANTIDTHAAYLTVNSDPATSIGHFTRATAENVGRLLEAWRAGLARSEEMPRLVVATGGSTWRILNDCLFSNANPAAMSRYLLEVDGQRELQRSSGVWVATAAGSTGAIHSAGGAPLAQGGAALLYRVREPFHGRGRLRLLEGRQTPPRRLHLTPAAPGMALYLDGPNITIPLRPGEVVEVRPADRPLRLLLG